MLFLVLQKHGREGVFRDPTPSDTPSDSDTELLFLSLTIRLTRMRNKTLIVCSALVVPLKTTI
jgi:hypothetical protein